LSTPEHQEKLKEEAKAIRTRLDALIKDAEMDARVIRLLCIYAGMITETLIEFEEPDVVMEQAFHRIADLLQADPEDTDSPDALMPLPYKLDHDTELGRQLGRATAKKLPKGLDDIHEIAIALIIDDFTAWEKQGYPRERTLRLLIEAVVTSLTFEMATQDFCDLLIEEFMGEDGNSPTQALLGLSAVAGFYYHSANQVLRLPVEADKEITNVMVRESVRHATPGMRDWDVLAAANDGEIGDITEFVKQLKPEIDEFFVLIGLDNPLARAVAVAKAVGRMVAVISVEDIGQIHPSIAKSLAKTGMILGAKYKEEAKA